MRSSDSAVASRKRGKRAIRELLTRGDLDAVVRQSRETGARRTYRHLLTFLHDRDDLVRWRAVVACGRVAGVLAKKDLEGVRELIRRILWWMNDESGALLRVGPEVLAEILVNVEPLVVEYADLLPTYVDEEPFERGALWAIARLAEARPGVLTDAADSIRFGMDSQDGEIRGHTWMALQALGVDGGANPGHGEATFLTYDVVGDALTARPIPPLQPSLPGSSSAR